MNGKIEKLHIDGSYKLLLASSGADISIIRAPSNSPSFGSLILCEKDIYSQNSEYDNINKHAVHTLYTHDRRAARMFDRFDKESGMFLRHIECSQPIPFKFLHERHSKLLHSKPLRSGVANFPAFCLYLPEGTKPDEQHCVQEKDSFLYIAFCGDVSYEPESGTVVFGIGKSCMLIAAEQEPNKLTKTVIRQLTKCSAMLGTSEGPVDIKNAELPDTAEYINAMTALTTKNGFVLSAATEPMIDPMTQYLCVRAFLHAGIEDRALAIIDAYYKRYTANSKIIWGEKGGTKELRSSCEGSVTPALVILAALSFPADRLPKKYMPMLCNLIKYQRSFLVRSMMPFNGNEPEAEAKYLTFHGSAFATLLFIESGRALCQRVRELDMKPLDMIEPFVDEAALQFHRNFIKDGIPLLNSPIRESASSRPRFKYGYCENCAPKSAHPIPCWTERTHYGIYLCPECTDKGSPERHPVFIDPSLRRISYMIVLRSALIGTSIYPRGLIRQICASVISYPENDVKSRYEAALLAYIARKYELERRYIDAADKLVFDNSYPGSFTKSASSGNTCYPEHTDAATYALMYMTYELPVIPKPGRRKRKTEV